jgi:hypothetical protein
VRDLKLPLPQVSESVPPSPEQSLAEFNHLAREIMADGVMTTAEFLILMDWLRDCPHTETYPINRLQEAVERVTAHDGQVRPEEQQRLEDALKFYLETGKAPPRPGDAAPGESAHTSAVTA